MIATLSTRTLIPIICGPESAKEKERVAKERTRPIWNFAFQEMLCR